MTRSKEHTNDSENGGVTLTIKVKKAAGKK